MRPPTRPSLAPTAGRARPYLFRVLPVRGQSGRHTPALFAENLRGIQPRSGVPYLGWYPFPCHPERSGCFAQRSSHAVEGPLLHAEPYVTTASAATRAQPGSIVAIGVLRLRKG